MVEIEVEASPKKKKKGCKLTKIRLGKTWAAGLNIESLIMWYYHLIIIVLNGKADSLISVKTKINIKKTYMLFDQINNGILLIKSLCCLKAILNILD